MRPVVAHLRAMGHIVYSNMDDFFGAPGNAIEGTPSTEADFKFSRSRHILVVSPAQPMATSDEKRFLWQACARNSWNPRRHSARDVSVVAREAAQGGDGRTAPADASRRAPPARAGSRNSQLHATGKFHQPRGSRRAAAGPVRCSRGIPTRSPPRTWSLDGDRGAECSPSTDQGRGKSPQARLAASAADFVRSSGGARHKI
jgi:hypothetical protein